MERDGVTWDAVVLAGGTARRLDGADKASLDLGGRSLLARALTAVDGARSVVVVGDPVATDRAVAFTREEPPHGGPVAAAYAGLDALVEPSGVVVVLAVDMPGVSAATVARLLEAAGDGDGAVLTHGGHRHLALAVARTALERTRPPDTEGVAVRALLGALALTDVMAEDQEAADVDTWDDLDRWRTRPTGPDA